MAATPQNQHDRARAMWRRCLASAFRTALACTIVGVATLYGPAYISRQITFPAFSYVTVILIITDATLGDGLRGCWLALYATVLGVCPSILSLWLIGPARLTTTTTSAVVAVSAFVVALPENTHLITKRIALGQIVLAYIIAFINGAETEPIMHPLHLAVSTALGVAACVLALLLPFPNLAYCQVTRNCKLYTENASERLKLFIKAFSADDKSSPNALICQAKSLNKAGNKFLHCIKSKQESMQWEIIPIKFLKSYEKNPGEKLQGLETILRGMENAVENCSEFPVPLLNTQLKDDIVTVEEKILNQVKNMAVQNSVLPQSDEDREMDNCKFLQTLHETSSTSLKDLPSLFFVFCLKLLLQTKPSSNDAAAAAKQAPKDSQKERESFLYKLRNNTPFTINKKRLMPALKCSLSLGFAVFFGLVYSKENGYWSGLPVAISLAAAREATFKVANIKAQGTVLGTVYGVVGCFVFERYVKIRFVSLLPWFIFSSFLRQSKMYGQAGGVSAVIGAVLILGRRNFGAPRDFAIARIVETFIGLSCSIMVDILLQPTRASVLAKLELSMSLQSLREAVEAINLGSSGLEERLKKLRFHVNELGKFIEEAEVEPNFWFLPFHSACYVKVKVSLSKVVDFLHFGSHALRFLDQESEDVESKVWNEAADMLETDLKLFKDAVCSRVKCVEEVILVKSIVELEEEYDKGKSCLDLEKGKSGNLHAIQWRSGRGDDDASSKKGAMSVLQHVDGFVGGEREMEEVKNGVVLSLGALLYCMDGVLKESKEIEKGIEEVVQWENPSRRVDLQDIVCKLRALKKSVTI
ncbi:P-hydroxybenzoic acid efflux pump subunit [Perilla frutescens var. frutescens]|nr:P-hydroxybenzoic acid efflux pump subunit [Perilla frutescens var. frutescens]